MLSFGKLITKAVNFLLTEIINNDNCLILSFNSNVTFNKHVKRYRGTRKAIFRSVTVYYIYNIGVLTVNIELMWRGLETGENELYQKKLYLGQ
jgi:hypothetical protein